MKERNQLQLPKMVFTIWAIIVGMALMLGVQSLTGCAVHRTTSTNPAVIRVVTLLDAENTVNTIAHGLAAADGTLKSLQAVEPDYYTYAHPKLVQIAFLNDRANASILSARNGNTSVDWKSDVLAVATAAGNTQALTTFGFKSAKSQQIARDGFAILATAIVAAGAFGGK